MSCGEISYWFHLTKPITEDKAEINFELAIPLNLQQPKQWEFAVWEVSVEKDWSNLYPGEYNFTLRNETTDQQFIAHIPNGFYTETKDLTALLKNAVSQQQIGWPRTNVKTEAGKLMITVPENWSISFSPALSRVLGSEFAFTVSHRDAPYTFDVDYDADYYRIFLHSSLAPAQYFNGSIKKHILASVPTLSLNDDYLSYKVSQATYMPINVDSNLLDRISIRFCDVIGRPLQNMTGTAYIFLQLRRRV